VHLHHRHHRAVALGSTLLPYLFGLLGILVTTSEMNEVLLKLCATGSLKSAKVVVPVNNRTAKGLWASSPVGTKKQSYPAAHHPVPAP
jgi:hypothetical protein